MSRTAVLRALLVAGLGLAPPASSDPIFTEGQHPVVDENMARHARQFYQLNARPFGLSLDGHYADDAARQAIEQFLAQDESDDFQAVTGRHPYQVLSGYGEFADLGQFGGVGMASAAFEYLTLRRDGDDADRLALARARVVRAAESWHVFYAVTGGGGLVARGIRRRTPEDPSAPPLPGQEPEPIPLADADGVPQPRPKSNGSWRADNASGGLPDGTWMWMDSCSKDQLLGQVFGLVVLYEAIKDDPDIDPGLVARMAEDARQVGQMLMTERDIAQLEGVDGSPLGEGVYDLIIMDADGRPTMYHDLNPKSFEKFYFPHDSPNFNRFNVIMTLGIIKGLSHVSGDPALEDYLYRDLMGERELLDLLSREEGAIDYIYMGKNTNWDNPDMTSLAIWLALYTENDPAVRAELLRFLEESWWAPADEPRYAARLAKQPLWHLLYLGLTERGADEALVAEAADLLADFQLGPYFNDARVNCDPDEIDARQCEAADGTQLTLVGESQWGGWMADVALDPHIRPPSNYDSRSNPFAVNGGGGNRLNPGGDLLAAYWMGRYLQANPPGQANLSAHARDHMPVGGWPDGGPDGGAPNTSTDRVGCGCGQGQAGAMSCLTLLLVWLGGLRRRVGRDRGIQAGLTHPRADR